MQARSLFKRIARVAFIILPFLILFVFQRMPWLIPDRQQQALLDVGEPVSAVAANTDHSLIAVAHGAGTISLWQPNTNKPLVQWNIRTTSIDTLAFLADGTTLIIGTYEGRIIVWDTIQQARRLDVITSFRLNHLSIKSMSNVAICSHQSLAAIGGWDGKLVAFDPRSGQTVNDIKYVWSETAPILAVACNNANTTLAFGITTGEVVLWNVATQKVEQLLKATTDVASTMIFSADDQVLAVAYRSGEVTYWSLPTSTQLEQGFRRQLGVVQFDPTARLIAYGGYQGFSVVLPIFDIPRDPRVYIAEASTGTICKTLHGHRDLITSVVWSADGHSLLSGSRDGTVRLWGVSGC
jgi:WD40 repeat protein